MLSFAATGVVSGIYPEMLRVINDYEYKVVRLKVGKSLEIYAFIDVRKDINVGDIIKSDNVYLTNYDEDKSPRELALRFSYFEVIPEAEYQPMDYLEVRCNGKLIKSANSQVRPVGVTKKPFLACTLSIKNESGNMFHILMVGTYGQAEKLNELHSNTYINVKARLFNKLNEPGFELNVISIETVGK